MFKVNNRNTRTRCEIFSKLTIKTPEQCQWHRPGFFVNFEHISHLVLLFLLLTLCRLMPTGQFIDIVCRGLRPPPFQKHPPPILGNPSPPISENSRTPLPIPLTFNIKYSSDLNFIAESNLAHTAQP